MLDFFNSPLRRYVFAGLFLFIGTSLIFLIPENGRFFYPLLFPSIAILREKDSEARFLLIFFASLIAIIFPYFTKSGKEEYSILISQMFLFWIIAYISHEKYSLASRIKQENLEKKILLNSEIQELKKKIETYRAHSKKAEKRIQSGKILLSSLKNIQIKSNPQDILSEIKASLQTIFPDCYCEIKTRIDSDLFCSSAFLGKTAVLIKNSKDPRFKKDAFINGEKSLIAIPLIVFSSVIAVVKISSKQEDRLNESDLRTFELLIKSASIGLENLNLFSQINELAMKDALTGLVTHRVFQDKLDSEILTSGRTKYPFSLIIVDIDHFKKYNDTYGHQAGDEVLKKTSSFFLSHIRDIDICARYGGEEFAIILPQTTLEQAAQVAENLRIGLSQIEFIFSNVKTQVSASFGVSCFPQDASTKSQLIRAADERLYKAKENGRNQVRYE